MIYKSTSLAFCRMEFDLISYWHLAQVEAALSIEISSGVKLKKNIPSLNDASNSIFKLCHFNCGFIAYAVQLFSFNKLTSIHHDNYGIPFPKTTTTKCWSQRRDHSFHYPEDARWKSSTDNDYCGLSEQRYVSILNYHLRDWDSSQIQLLKYCLKSVFILF